MKTIGAVSTAAAIALSLISASGAVLAGGIKTEQAVNVDLGPMAGVAYYTREDQGYHVVVTLAPREGGVPLRVEAILAANQSVTVSSPVAVGGLSPTVQLTRKGDSLIVTPERIAARS